jgi:hypothetical protein
VLHRKDSQYLRPDVPAAFFATLTLWFTIRAWERPGAPVSRAWLLPGAAVGLAAASKYNSAVVAVVPLAGLIFAMLRNRDVSHSVTLSRFVRVSSVTALASTVAFLLVNPYALITPHDFLSPDTGIRYELNHYRTGHDGSEGDDTWRWYLTTIRRLGFGPDLTPIMLLGCVAALGQSARLIRRDTALPRGTQLVLMTAVFVPVYYGGISTYPVRFDRQLMPLLPYLAILAGIGLGSLVGIWNVRRTTTMTLAAIVLAVVTWQSVAPVQEAAAWNIKIGKRESRYYALDWLEAHVAPGTMIVREWHTPPLKQAGFEEVMIRKANDQTRDWYQASGAEYLILSSGMYQRYVRAPETYPNEAAFYERLLAAPRVATISAEYGPVIIILRIEDALPALPEATATENEDDETTSAGADP